MLVSFSFSEHFSAYVEQFLLSKFLEIDICNRLDFGIFFLNI